jgi:hypothetical protein
VVHYDQEFAVEIANRINGIMQTLPSGTQPATVLTGLAAVSARLLIALRKEDREPAFQFMMGLMREHGGLPSSQ